MQDHSWSVGIQKYSTTFLLLRGGAESVDPLRRQAGRQSGPVSLSCLFVLLTPEGPGLSQGPALLRLPPRLLGLLCSPGTQRRPLLALVQLLLQLRRERETEILTFLGKHQQHYQ
ncbi:hypothetical protein INR49_006361 [Caranx melampygus]|nr:hypothetical protein INR49_006361 [Caranx melampygus]